MPSHAPIATGGLRDWRGRCPHPNKSLICRGPRAACCRPSGVPPRRAAGAAQHGLRHRPVLVPAVKLAVCLALAGAGQGFPALTPVGYHAARLVEGIFKAIVVRQPLGVPFPGMGGAAGITRPNPPGRFFEAPPAQGACHRR